MATLAQTLVLSAATVATYTFTNTSLASVVVTVSGAAGVSVTTDGSTPTVGGAATYTVPQNFSMRIPVDGYVPVNTALAPAAAANSTVVKVISSGTPTVTVAP